MENDFLTSIQKEGEDPFENKDEQEKETPAAPSAEEKPEEGKEPSQEGEKNTPDAEDVPFHKHPRWQERERELEALRAEIEDLKSAKEETPPSDATGPDEWFREAFGENEMLWQKFNKYTASLKEEIKAEFVRDQEQARQQEQETLQNLTAKFDADIQELKDEGKKFDENELRQIAADYFPTDENGIVSMRKAYGIYDAMRSRQSEEKSSARKDLAAKTTSDDKGETTPKDYVTAAEARRMSWT